MDIVDRIEKKLDEVLAILDKKDKDLNDARKITKTLYEELLKVKKIKHEQKNNGRS